MIDPISANLIAASFSGLAGFNMRSERDSTRVQGVDKSSNADRNSRFSDSLKSRLSSSSKSSKVPEKNTDATGLKLSEEEKEVIRKLQERDSEVRAHEQAHMAAAGGLARGGANYTFTQGPDGKQYAVGGSVSIDTSVDSSDPEKMKQKARQIQAAALAPADPSSQDMAVAASATQMSADAEAKKAEETRNKNEDANSTTDSSETSEASETSDSSEASNSSDSSDAIENQTNSTKTDNSKNTNRAENSASAGADNTKSASSVVSANSKTQNIEPNVSVENNAQAVNLTRTAYAPQNTGTEIQSSGNVRQSAYALQNSNAETQASGNVRQYGTSSNFEGAASGYAIFNGALKFSGEMGSVLPLVNSLAKPSMNNAMKSYAQVANYGSTIYSNDSQSSNMTQNMGQNTASNSSQTNLNNFSRVA